MISLTRFFVVIAVFAVSSAQASGLLLEPYIGYGMTTTTGTVKSSGAKFSTENNGLGLGGRLGYMFMGGLWLAGDYAMYLETDLKTKEPAGQADQKITASSAYVDVGFDLPMIPLRFWAGYAFMDNASIKDTSPTTDYSGTGYKVGLGVKPIPMLSINLEYLMHTHNKYKTSGGTDLNVSDVYDDYKSSTIFLSVSIPFMPMGK